MKRLFYKLDDQRQPVPCDVYHGVCEVAVTVIDTHVAVSTIFLGIDHSYAGGRPILFETMIFGGPLDGAGRRYVTWEEAEIGHEQMVSEARIGMRPRYWP